MNFGNGYLEEVEEEVDIPQANNVDEDDDEVENESTRDVYVNYA